MSIQANFPAIKPTLLLDFANTEALDPRITFTRASTGTYYDGKTVAKAEENLLLQSQAFDNASWVNSGTITTTANTTAAPDGTITADRLQIAAGNTFKYQNISLISGATYVISVYVMSNTGSNQTFRLFGNDLSSSSADQTATTSWQRFTFTYTASSASSVAVGIRTDIANTAADILVWGAQLEQRASATAYTPTTTQPVTNYIPVLLTAASGVPRFEHNPVTGESLGLEIEEQRTNLLLRSEEFDNAAWLKSGAAVTANTTVSPDGLTSADSITFSSSADYVLQLYFATYAAGASYSWSVYVKSAIRAIGWGGASPAGTDTYTSTFVGNGWYRQVLTRTFTTSGTGVTLQLLFGGNQPIGTGTFSVWGAQLEAGAFPTSYIPTVASQVTRAADSAVMTGANFSSWYRQDEGTFYSEAAVASVASTTQQNIWSLFTDTSNNTRLWLWEGAPSTLRFSSFNSGAQQWDLITSGMSANTFFKNAGVYKTNDFAMSTNAGTVQTDTSGLIARGFTGINIGSQNGIVGFMNGTIRKIAYYPARVTNTQLQALTS